MVDDAKDMNTELSRAATLIEEAISALGVTPASVRMPAPEGHAWSLMRGSAAIAIFARPARGAEDSPHLRVISPIVLVDKGNELALYKRLLELNAAGLGTVAFGLHDDRVVAVCERPVRDLDPSEVRYLVQAIGAVADHYDDELVRLFGGTKVSDKQG